MSQRSVRLNKLVANELNLLLHTVFRDAACNISVTETAVSPDMRDAYIYFSVVGEATEREQATKFLAKKTGAIRRKLFQKIRIKFSPRLHFKYDDSLARGQRILETLDSLEG